MDACQKSVLKYLTDQNRPYSTNDIVLNMHKVSDILNPNSNGFFHLTQGNFVGKILSKILLLTPNFGKFRLNFQPTQLNSVKLWSKSAKLWYNSVKL